MGRKSIKHIISFLIVFVLLFGFFCPSTFFAATKVYESFGDSTGSGTYNGHLYPDSAYVIPDSVYYASPSISDSITLNYQFYYLIDGFPVPYDYFSIDFVVKNFTVSSIASSGVYNYALCFGTETEFRNGDYHILCTENGTTSISWSGESTVNIDYGLYSKVFFGIVFWCKSTSSVSSSGTSNTFVPSVNMSFTYDVEVFGQDISSTYSTFYEYLTNIYYDQLDVLSVLQEINANTDTIEGKLSSLVTYVQNNYNKLVSIDTRIVNIYTQLTQIGTKLDKINTGIGDINSELNTQTGILGSISSGISNFYDKFLEYTGMGSDSSAPSAPNTSGVSSSIQMEQNLLNKDTSGAVNNLNIMVDISANSTIWDLITRALNTHVAVFGGFITLLSIGVIKLFFGR